MSAYNLKVFNYADGVQFRMYNQSICVSEKIDTIHELSFDSLLSEQLESSDVRTESNYSRSEFVSKNRTIQKMYEITRANHWEYFLTITFNPKFIDRSNYDLLSEKTSKWLNNIKSRYAPDLKYIIVPELHSDGVNYHFHGLLSNIGFLSLVDSGHKVKGASIYNLENWNYGFSTVSKVKDSAKCASYITKYITKDLCAVTKNKRRYWVSKNCDKVKIDSYNLPYEQIAEFVNKNQHLLTYAKESVVSDSGLVVTYFEFKKGDKNV